MALAPPAPRARRHRALLDDHRGARGVAGHELGRPLDGDEVRLARGTRWGAHAQECHAGVAEGVRRLGGEPEPACVDLPADELLEPGLEEGHAAAPEELDLL